MNFEEFEEPTIELLDFSGWPHYQRHINYLFRTDQRQKWTNRYTANNLMIFDRAAYMIGRDLEERQKTAKAARKMVRDIKADYSDLRMCCVYIDESEYSSGTEVVDDVIEIMQEMDDDFKEKGMRILFGVIHTDQDDLHFHLVIRKIC